MMEALVLKSLLNQCNEDTRKKLLSFLPEETRKKIEKSDLSIDPTDFDQMVATLLEEVHYSWLFETIQKFPKKERSFFLLALPEKSAKKLQNYWRLSLPKTKKLTSFAKRYFCNLLLKNILSHDTPPLPIKDLPLSPLSPLLSLSKEKLLFLIDDLALLDLRSEMRKMVETTLLKKLSYALDKRQKKILRSYASYSEPLSAPPLGLDKWDGTKETLMHLLHKRGLFRLATALCFEDRCWIWHLAHKLDVGRGSFLLKQSQKEQNREIVAVMVDNIKTYLSKQQEEM